MATFARKSKRKQSKAQCAPSPRPNGVAVCNLEPRLSPTVLLVGTAMPALMSPAMQATGDDDDDPAVEQNSKKTLSNFVTKFTSLIVAVPSCFDRVIFK
jgi:hypothetical protein